MSTEGFTKAQVHDAVRSTYGAVARQGSRAEAATACCGSAAAPAVENLSDYTAAELAAVPQGAYLGEGSGAPVRYAGLSPGEVVVDLGSGAGMDTFLAANEVGPSGRVYGFDLTPEMLERARENAAAGGYGNVSFASADIEHLALATHTADAAISNCVINLAPDKAAVYREIFRVLRPAGRLSVADIVLRGSEHAVRAFREKSGPEAWCACVSGALREEEYTAAIRAAGFTDVRVVAERPAFSQPGGSVAAVAITVTARKPA